MSNTLPNFFDIAYDSGTHYAIIKDSEKAALRIVEVKKALKESYLVRHSIESDFYEIAAKNVVYTGQYKIIRDMLDSWIVLDRNLEEVYKENNWSR